MSVAEVITVISALTVVIDIAVSLLNKRIDNLRKWTKGLTRSLGSP